MSKINVVGAVLLLAAVSASAASPTLGTPFQVNTIMGAYISYIIGGDNLIGMADNGDFVITWAQLDGSGSGVYYRRFSADGTAKDVVQVPANTQIAGEQACVSLGVRGDGSFDIGWTTDYDPTFSLNYESAVMRGFNADGTQRYAEQVVDAAEEIYDPGSSTFQKFSKGLHGNGIAVNDSYTEFLCRGSSANVPVSQHKWRPGEMSTNGTITDSPDTWVMAAWENDGFHNSAIAMNGNGDAVVFGGRGQAWENNWARRGCYMVYDRATQTWYTDTANASGTPLSPPEDVRRTNFCDPAYTLTSGVPTAYAPDGKFSHSADDGKIDRHFVGADVAINEAGQGIMVWTVNDAVYENSDPDGGFAAHMAGNMDVVARRFTLTTVAGLARVTFLDASEWYVTTAHADDPTHAVSNDKFLPMTDIDEDGRFMITWTDSDKNIYGKAYAADASVLADKFQLNQQVVDVGNRATAADVAVDKGADGSLDFAVTYAWDTNEWDPAVRPDVCARIGSIGPCFIAGDLDHDGDVDIFDWAIFQPNFGTSCVANPIPEPVTLMLLGLGGIAIFRRQRHA